MIRYCKQFYCPERGDRYCCADCFLREDCANRCLNHPSRCRLENISKREDPNDPREKDSS